MKWMEPHLGFLILEGQQLGVVHHRHHFGDQVDFLADHRQEHARHEKNGAGECQDDARDYKDSGKYMNDYQKMNMKMMETYQKYGVNPLSQIGGCLPMLIQIPVFFGFFTMLRRWNCGWTLWVIDLSAPDTIAEIAGFLINILPLLMTGTMSANEAPTGRSEYGSHSAGDHEIHAADVRGVLYSASSGLCLY